MSPLRIAFVVAAVAAAVGCSTPVQGTVDAARLDPVTFAKVDDVLLVRCGSVDCHGSPYRNFRLVGFGASRLAPQDRPDAPTTTSAAEHRYNYEGLVGLEPETMVDVAASKGARMDELTFVRKARGEENHKGDRRIVRGDDADVCLRSWFAATLDESACARAAAAK